MTLSVEEMSEQVRALVQAALDECELVDPQTAVAEVMRTSVSQILGVSPEQVEAELIGNIVYIRYWPEQKITVNFTRPLEEQ